MAKRKICTVDGCTEEIVYRKAGLCAACYSGMYYWKGRTPTDIVARQHQLARLASRMDLMLPHVRSIRRRRRRA